MSASYVLVVDDEPDIRQLIKEILEDEGYEVELAESAAAARAARKRRRPDLVLLDIWMPDEDGITLLNDWRGEKGPQFPVVMISGHGTVETAVEATRLGAVDFVEKPLSMGRLLVTVERVLSAQRSLEPDGASSDETIEPVGHSSLMAELREQARRLAASGGWVLIQGEAGAGKQCFARYLHSLATPRRGPLIEVAAGAVAGEAAAAELFGRERDGQVSVGRLEAATGGTLLVDEIADLDMTAQTRLVSAIEAGSFQRVGGSDSVALDTRVLALTRTDLKAQVEAGRFREDLFYHLRVIPVAIPPLREHVEDVPELLAFYVDRLVERERLPYRRFAVAAQNRLRNYDWPGNVRELRNLVQRVLVLGDGLDIGVAEVERALSAPVQSADPSAAASSALSLDVPLREAREAFERLYLQHQLKRAEGSVAQLARLTGMERTHLYRKLRALGIDPKEGV